MLPLAKQKIFPTKFDSWNRNESLDKKVWVSEPNVNHQELGFRYSFKKKQGQGFEMKCLENSQQFLKEIDAEDLAVRNGSFELANGSIDYYPPTNCGAVFGPNFDI